MTLPAYAELHALSNFSFQRGASHAEELVERAAALGYSAIAITDECSVAGVVRAHGEAQKHGLQLLPGAEFLVQCAEPFRLVVLPHNAEGWGNLCEFITQAKAAGDVVEKGSYLVTPESDLPMLQHCEVIFCLPQGAINTEAACARINSAKDLFDTKLWIAVELLQALDDALRLQQLQDLSQQTGVPLVASGAVLMHVRSRKPLHDVLTAVGMNCTVHDCGFALAPNAEAHLRPRMRLASLYPPDLLAATLEVARRCTFDLDEIRDLYRYPQGAVRSAESPIDCLRRLTTDGAQQRYPQGLPEKIAAQVAHELALIDELGYAMYFITVHDIVKFAIDNHILCQGRGSAANSAVCYCLAITAVDPAESQLLFERFISRERKEPPDIDVDFEHQRREEVIQYIYAKYGHEHAAIAATVTTYRPRSAIRDVGKALGIAPSMIEQFAKENFWFDKGGLLAKRLEEANISDAKDAGPVLQWLDLTVQLLGFPRHLGQHVGGFVLTQTKLTRLVPIQPATMEARRIIQWDKDDLDAMGLLKVDVLALGMLSAIRRSLQLIDQWRGGHLQMHQIPSGDEQTYDMICAADTVGVFQIESRAQMSMLPRLKPRCFYDLVVEVAIVRPGPIQGGMVHPYLKRRANPQLETYPNEELRRALGRTLGVPIFQEQVMQIAMVAADFTAGEADDLRRSMAAWKRKGGVKRFYDRLVGRMVERGYERTFADNIFKQIEGFGEYGFPESHAASFAKLVYISCWLKCHEPACFFAALVNSQPMGFYSPSQLMQDAKRHGVQVRAVDVTCSDWDCTLESPVLQTADRPEPGLLRAVQERSSAPGAAARSPNPLPAGEGVNTGRSALRPLPLAGEGGGECALAAGVQHAPSGSPHPNPLPGGEGVNTGRSVLLPLPGGEGVNTGRSVLLPLPLAGEGRGEGSAAFKQTHPHSKLHPGIRPSQPAIRLGLRLVSGLSEQTVNRILAARQQTPFTSVEDLCLRAQLNTLEVNALAAADALALLAGHRRQQVWQAAAIKPQPLLLKAVPTHEAALNLPDTPEGENILFDYRATGLTLRRHPLALLRPRLAEKGFLTAAQLDALPDGEDVAACGIVTLRQQPSTAKGVIFLTIEDDTGPINVIVWKSIRVAQRQELLHSTLLGVHGVWQRSTDQPGALEGFGAVRNLIAKRLEDLSPLLGRLGQGATRSQDFH
jgi:error-prone DNA polymerase